MDLKQMIDEAVEAARARRRLLAKARAQAVTMPLFPPATGPLVNQLHHVINSTMKSHVQALPSATKVKQEPSDESLQTDCLQTDYLLNRNTSFWSLQSFSAIVSWLLRLGSWWISLMANGSQTVPVPIAMARTANWKLESVEEGRRCILNCSCQCWLCRWGSWRGEFLLLWISWLS